MSNWFWFAFVPVCFFFSPFFLPFIQFLGRCDVTKEIAICSLFFFISFILFFMINLKTGEQKKKYILIIFIFSLK